MSSLAIKVNKLRKNDSSHYAKQYNRKSQRDDKMKKSKQQDSSDSRGRLSPPPVLGSDSDNNINHTNSNGNAARPTKKNTNSDASLQKSVKSEGTFTTTTTTTTTIDPSEDPTLEEVMPWARTSEEVSHLIEMMQAEFKKLRSAKIKVEMKAQTLETDLARMQQERDAEYLKLREELEYWKRESHREKVRWEVLQESMQGKLNQLKDENHKLSADRSRAIMEKNELKENVAALEKDKDCRMKKGLSKNQSYQSSGEHNGEGKDDRHQIRGGFDSKHNESYVSLSDTRPHEISSRDGSIMASSLPATATVSVASASLITRSPKCYLTPLSAPQSSHRHAPSLQQASLLPHSTHVHRRPKDDTHNLHPQSISLTQAPTSWQGGNNKTKSTLRVPGMPHSFPNGIEIAPAALPLPPACSKTRSLIRKPCNQRQEDGGENMPELHSSFHSLDEEWI